MQGLHQMLGSMCSGKILLKMTIHFFFVCQVCEKLLQYLPYITFGIICFHKKYRTSNSLSTQGTPHTTFHIIVWNFM
jgi:uncharacterized membrane protein SirB2